MRDPTLQRSVLRRIEVIATRIELKLDQLLDAINEDVPAAPAPAEGRQERPIGQQDPGTRGQP